MKIACWTLTSTSVRAAARDEGVALAMAGSMIGHRSFNATEFGQELMLL
jgi:hypothetical protein